MITYMCGRVYGKNADSVFGTLFRFQLSVQGKSLFNGINTYSEQMVAAYMTFYSGIDI